MQRGVEVHLQAIPLHNADIDGLAGISHRLVKQPFRRRRANLYIGIGAGLLQTTDDLVGTDRVTIAMTGYIIKN